MMKMTMMTTDKDKLAAATNRGPRDSWVFPVAADTLDLGGDIFIVALHVTSNPEELTVCSDGT